MKPWIVGILLILSISVSGISESPYFDSAVCDFIISENEIDGYCKITAESGGVDIFNLTPPKGAIVERVKESRDSVILSIRKDISSNDFEIPLPVFPYRIKGVLISVQAPESKFVWEVNFPTESKEDDKILVQKYLGDLTVEELDKELYELRRYTSKSSQFPDSEYRLYLGEIGANENLEVRAWVGKGYEYYLPYAIVAILLCGILFSTFYFVSRRL